MIEVLTFDPADIQRLFEQDAIGDEYGAWPAVSKHEIRTKTDSELARFINDLRDAVLLPLDDTFIDGMRGLLDFASNEAMNRMRARDKREAGIRRAKANGTYQAWEEADLLAEVAAVCGEGKQRGREWWFLCALHTESTPSLHVDPETRRWHCFGCQKGGGVVQWRRLNGQ